METKRKIGQALRKLMVKAATLDAEVTAVDKDQYTCDVKLANGIEYYDVQLKALRELKTGCVELPKVGSHVQMIPAGDTDWLIIKVGEVDEVIILADKELSIDAGGTKLLLQKDLLQVNDGKNGGLVKIAEILKSINAIEDDINNLKTAFSTWVVTPQDGGSKLYGAATTWFQQRLKKTTKQSIENDKVTH